MSSNAVQLVQADCSSLEQARNFELRSAAGGVTPGTAVRLIAGADNTTTGASRAMSTTIEISITGALIADVTRDCGDIKASGVVRASVPMAIKPSVPQAIAQALKRSLSESGLFYESHLVEWTEGTRALDTLRREPQAQFPLAVIDATQGEDASAAPALATLDSPLAHQALGLIREQLNALTAQHISWHGPLWQGQPGKIEVGRDPLGPTDSTDQVWHARLAVDLPELGAVEMTLALHGHILALSIATHEQAAHAMLSAEQASLLSSLEAQGLRPQARFDCPSR